MVRAPNRCAADWRSRAVGAGVSAGCSGSRFQRDPEHEAVTATANTKNEQLTIVVSRRSVLARRSARVDISFSRTGRWPRLINQSNSSAEKTFAKSTQFIGARPSGLVLNGAHIQALDRIGAENIRVETTFAEKTSRASTVFRQPASPDRVEVSKSWNDHDQTDPERDEKNDERWR